VPKRDIARHARAGGSRHHPTMHGRSNQKECSMCGGRSRAAGMNNLGPIKEEIREEVDDYGCTSTYCSCEHCTSGNPLIWSEVQIVGDDTSVPFGRREHTLDQYLTQLAIKKNNTSDTVSVLSEAASSELESWDMVSGATGRDDDSCFSDYSMIMSVLDYALPSEEEASA
jgi:hypothetical protein